MYKDSANQTAKNELVYYPTSGDLTSGYAFGFLVGIVLCFQLLTGLFMASHYDASINFAFASIDHVLRDLPYGSFVKNMHLMGASSFFICLYLHMGKAIYNGSYIVNRAAWNVGLIIFILTMLTAFCGYCLPFGQMSYWGTIVITNLVGVVGKSIVTGIWGAYEITDTLLQRFLVLHFILPFVISFLVMIHIFLVHRGGSSSIVSKRGNRLVNFTPYYIFKDSQFLSALLFVMFYVVLYNPDSVNHPDNFAMADPLVTPAHIQPEWYFLPYYAILRAVPNKDFGIVLMGLSILGFAFFGFDNNSDKEDRQTQIWLSTTNWNWTFLFNKFHQIISIVFFFIFILLTYLGSAELDVYTQKILSLSVICYFACMLFFIDIRSNILAPYVEDFWYWSMKVDLLSQIKKLKFTKGLRNLYNENYVLRDCSILVDPYYKVDPNLNFSRLIHTDGINLLYYTQSQSKNYPNYSWFAWSLDDHLMGLSLPEYEALHAEWTWGELEQHAQMTSWLLGVTTYEQDFWEPKVWSPLFKPSLWWSRYDRIYLELFDPWRYFTYEEWKWYEDEYLWFDYMGKYYNVETDYVPESELSDLLDANEDVDELYRSIDHL